MNDVAIQIPKKIIVIGVLVLFFLLSLALGRGGATKSSVQIAYEAWLQSINPVTRTGEFEVGKKEPITVELRSNLSSLQADWKLTEKFGPMPDQKIFRILELIKEAELFETGRAVVDSDNIPGIVVVISEGKTKLAVALDENKVASNVKAMTLLKLFEVYSTEAVG